jgi:hypothetical protein
LLDLTTLIDTALDGERYGTLIGSAPVTSIRQGAVMLLQTLDQNFPTFDDKTGEVTPMRARYAAAMKTLALAGITISPDNSGRYVAQRETWEPLVRRVAPTLGYSMNEIDAACARGGAKDSHQSN